MAVHEMPLKDIWHHVRRTSKNRRRAWPAAHLGKERRKDKGLTRAELSKALDSEFDAVLEQLQHIKNKGG